MSSYLFGHRHGPIHPSVQAAYDRICKAEGGYGFTYLKSEERGWFSAPDQGEPFNSRLEENVFNTIDLEAEHLDTGRKNV